jgi:hypothetical protein
VPPPIDANGSAVVQPATKRGGVPTLATTSFEGMLLEPSKV